MTRTSIAIALALAAFACASKRRRRRRNRRLLPNLRVRRRAEDGGSSSLEDQRVLRDPTAPPDFPPAPALDRGQPAPAVAPPPPPPDLVRLLSDEEARVRRRAALAVGRAGMRDGVQPLIALLSDAEPEVRQMAAFALGLIGDARARQPLEGALADTTPLVQGSAAEALGLIGDAATAPAIARMMAQVMQSDALASTPVKTPTRGGTRGRRSALRLRARPVEELRQLAATVLDQAGQPRVRWWPGGVRSSARGQERCPRSDARQGRAPYTRVRRQGPGFPEGPRRCAAAASARDR